MIIVHDFSSRSGYGLNPVRLPDSRKWTVNCNHLQSPFRAGPAAYYQSLPRHSFTASSVDFHWVGNSVRESNQSAVDATCWGQRAGSRGASSGRPFVEKLGRIARRRTVWSPCASSSVWSGCCSARTPCHTLGTYEVFLLQQKKDKKLLEKLISCLIKFSSRLIFKYTYL